MPQATVSWFLQRMERDFSASMPLEADQLGIPDSEGKNQEIKDTFTFFKKEILYLSYFLNNGLSFPERLHYNDIKSFHGLSYSIKP